MTKGTAKAATKRPGKEKLIPVISDLEALHHCAARTLCEMARGRSKVLAKLTLGDLRTALEKELLELEQAIEEIDLLIAEQGEDQKALQLDLQPPQIFAKIRARCAACD
jgi:hypothetical protein